MLVEAGVMSLKYQGNLWKYMNEKYRYGKSVAEVSKASGVSGVLTKDIDGNYFFRIYHQDKTFTDYDLNHDDLPITIDSDALASFYDLGNRKILDHSPNVLGFKKCQ